MATFWFIVGAACFLAFAVGVAPPSGSPVTTYLTFASLAVGMACGDTMGRRRLSAPWLGVGRARFWFQAACFIALSGAWVISRSAVSIPWTVGVWSGYEIPDRMSHAPASRSSPGAALSARLAAWGLVLFVAAVGDTVLRVTTLDPSDTMGQFNRARFEDAWQLQRRLCWDGACLEPVDWACGFEPGDDEDFMVCFEDVAARADESTSIETARLYCGRTVMRFVGEHAVAASPQECVALGGRWGGRTERPAVTFVR